MDKTTEQLLEAWANATTALLGRLPADEATSGDAVRALIQAGIEIAKVYPENTDLLEFDLAGWEEVI